MKKNKWNPENDKLLGTDTDKAIAQQLRVKHKVIFTRRTELGILPNRGGTKWTPEMDVLLTTMTNREVARKLELSYTVVGERRIKLGMKQVHQPFKRSIEQIQADYALVGYNQRELARLYKVSPQRAGQLVQRVKRVELVNA